MGIYFAIGIIALVVGIGIALAIEERNNVQKRQAQIEKDLQELKELIKEKTNYQDVEV
jgi:uncharacterized membrane-anchored protein YhcB (DUF1043 family)